MFDKRNKLSGQVEIEARNYFKESLETVPRNVRLSEALSQGMPVLCRTRFVRQQGYFKFTEQSLEQDKQVERQHDKLLKVRRA